MLSHTHLSILAAAIATGTVGFLPASAHAQDRPLVVKARPLEQVLTRRVSYADLNLATFEGEKSLNRRVGLAVNDVCSDPVETGSLYYAHPACRKIAWQGARPQIDRAVQRARDIAATGSSSIAAATITLSFAK